MEEHSVFEGLITLALAAVIANAFGDQAKKIALVVSIIAVVFWGGICFIKKGNHIDKVITSLILVGTNLLAAGTSVASAERLIDISGIQILIVTGATISVTLLNLFIAVKNGLNNEPMIIPYFPEAFAIFVHVGMILINAITIKI